MKKRLVIVIWNMGIGGIQKRMCDVAVDITANKKDWEVYFLIRRRQTSPFIHMLRNCPRVHLVYYPFQSGVRFPLGFVAWTTAQYIRLRPHVVLTFLVQLTIMMSIIRTLVFWQRTTLVINEGAYVSGYLKYNNFGYLGILLRMAYASVNRIIVPTNACARDLTRVYAVAKRKITIIPNWTLLPPTTSRGFKYECVFIGRFEHEKNPLGIVEVVRAVVKQRPNFRCAIIGDGNLKEQLALQIRMHQLSTCIFLLPSSVDARDLLKGSRILLVPSFNEGMPNVVLEAAMNRVPAVVNHFPGANEVIVSGKTGYITNSPVAMADRVIYLINNQAELRRLGAQAQRYIQKNFHRARQKEFIRILLDRT